MNASADDFAQATALLLEALCERPSEAIGRVSIASLQRLTEAAGVSRQTGGLPEEEPGTSARALSSPVGKAPSVAQPLQTQPPQGEPDVSAQRAPGAEVPTEVPLEDLAARVRAAMTATQPVTTTSRAPTVLPGDAAPDPAERAREMDRLRERTLVALAREPLARHCDRFVFGAGNAAAEVMFVGEAPGAEEEATGEPFVGKSGELLTKIIEAMGLKRSEVYLANVLKWRPEVGDGKSGNRKPHRDEIAACLPYLKEQIGVIRPKCLVALGETAAEALIGSSKPIGELRGQWHEVEGTPLMPTYHPAHLLRNQTLGEKRKVWEDLLQVMKQVGLPISARQRSYFLPK